MKKETDELNEKILESARSEFLAYGYQDASLRRICRAAGLTTGALYKRYESKDTLFATLLEPTLIALDQYGQEQKIQGRAFHPAVNAKIDELTEGYSSRIQLRALIENIAWAEELIRIGREGRDGR